GGLGTTMNETLAFLARHGTTVVFAAVFIEQLGVPIPAAPVLLAAGALVVSGKINLLLALGAALFGSLLADLIWFYLGRRNGSRTAASCVWRASPSMNSAKNNRPVRTR